MNIILQNGRDENVVLTCSLQTLNGINAFVVIYRRNVNEERKNCFECVVSRMELLYTIIQCSNCSCLFDTFGHVQVCSFSRTIDLTVFCCMRKVPYYECKY